MLPKLSPAFVTQGIPRLRDVLVDRKDPRSVYWLEQRPDDEGRTSLHRAPLDGHGAPQRVSPPGFDVRTKVHEYGGAAAWVEDGRVYASSGSDGRLWSFSPGAQDAKALTPPGPWRFADFRRDPSRPRLYAVVETATGAAFPQNALAAIATTGGAPRILAEGADFYASPRPSPDGGTVAWVQWRHPHLPWERTELVVADVDDTGGFRNVRRVAGDDGSVVDPHWHPDGSLWFASDRTGRWNLYRADIAARTVTALPPLAGEQALPHWVFGRPLFDFDAAGNVYSAAIVAGRTSLWRLVGSGWIPWSHDESFRTFEPLRMIGDRAVGLASGPYRASAVVTVDGRTGTLSVVRAASASPRTIVDYEAHALELPRRDGGSVHAFVYVPSGAAEPPPGIVSVHGGPTAQASFAPDATVLFWLSQGFVWIDVNYGGSTGYGRDYRDRLHHRWGDVDVTDCEDAAKALRDRGIVGALAIRGGSAGGYTALRAVQTPGLFSAATSAYGVTDLSLLFADTHKFEAFYGEWLLGTADPAKLRALSPAATPDRITTPVLFLQGLDDKVVPPSQSETLYRSLVARGLPAEYVPFPNEGHGFRRADTIEKALATELAFYRRVLGAKA